MIQKPHSAGLDLRVSISDAVHRYSCSVHRFFIRGSSELRFTDAEMAASSSPFKVPGTGWAPQGRVGVSPEAPAAGREKSLLSLRLQTTGGKL
ncbi:hypothetical protein NDU88_005361 [Pleurodeles waltl]|uniref:Uncharacterized protein n=1 Tax=Pleurodeles waltl TaxID=8319 RepID=A0AAV7MW65_PLEWA|nr:hypothetical protein NDU88_005361 [Pleurodeles waltl]